MEISNVIVGWVKLIYFVWKVGGEHKIVVRISSKVYRQLEIKTKQKKK